MGLTDSTVIDLENYERLQVDQLSFDSLPLNRLEIDDGGLEQLREAILRGNSLPYIIVLEAHCPHTESIGRAYLGDLGGWAMAASGPADTPSKGASLEKSITHLKTLLLELEQPSASPDFARFPLTALLAPFLLPRTACLTLLLDIVADGSARGLANGLSLGESIRKMWSAPEARFRDRSPDTVAHLQEEAEKQHLAKREALAQVKSLKRQLHDLEREQAALASDLSATRSEAALAAFEREYLLTTMALEAVVLRDAIKEWQLAACRAEEEACAQGLQAAELVELTLLRQREQQQLEKGAKEREKDLGLEMSRLSHELAQANKMLEDTRNESSRLSSDYRAANERIRMLTSELQSASTAKEEALAKHGAESPVRRAQEKEIHTLRRQLEVARVAEGKLDGLLNKSEARAEAHRQVLADLERQLAHLKMENATLINTSQQSQQQQFHAERQKREEARLKEKDSEVSRALAKMEAEWKSERQAMQAMLDDFKKTVSKPTIKDAPVAVREGKDRVTVSKSLPPAVASKKAKHPQPASRRAKEDTDSDTYEEEETPEVKKTRRLKAQKQAETSKEAYADLGLAKDAVKHSLARPIPKKPANGPVLAQPDVTMPKSPVKQLWKPASFLPHVKRPAEPKAAADAQENVSVLANLTFGGDERSKRIKLPNKADAAGIATAPAASQNPGHMSMFRSAMASANPLADPSVLPSIIANFNVKIPPKPKQ